MSNKTLFKVVFMSQGQVYEIYAREVGHGAMFGFIEVEQLVFGERTSIVVDPSDTGITDGDVVVIVSPPPPPDEGGGMETMS